MLVHAEQSTHWYLPDGTPRYGATLREARKEHLLPSVTTVLSVIAQPGLDAWKQEQAILSALTLPRLDGEPLDAFAKRVVADSKEHASTAADIGTAIHNSLERYIADGTIVPVDGYGNVLSEARTWLSDNFDMSTAMTELCGVGDGYAGRVDLIVRDHDGQWCVVDFKSQNVKRYAKQYSKHRYQLAAYAGMEFGDFAFHKPPRLINLVISTNADNQIIKAFELETPEDRDRAATGFMAAHELWQVEKGYYV